MLHNRYELHLEQKFRPSRRSKCLRPLRDILDTQPKIKALFTLREYGHEGELPFVYVPAAQQPSSDSEEEPGAEVRPAAHAMQPMAPG